MTTVVALRHAGATYFASDTAAVDNTGAVWPVASKLTVRRTGATAFPGLVIGHTGHRMTRPVLDHLDLDDAPATGRDQGLITIGMHAGSGREAMLDRWAQRLADRIATDSRDRRVPIADDGLIDHAQLVGLADRLWFLTDGLAEPVAGDAIAIGSGAEIALGYLYGARPHITEPHYAPEDVVREAVAHAIHRDSTSGGAVHVVVLAHDTRRAYDHGVTDAGAPTTA